MASGRAILRVHHVPTSTTAALGESHGESVDRGRLDRAVRRRGGLQRRRPAHADDAEQLDDVLYALRIAVRALAKDVVIADPPHCIKKLCNMPEKSVDGIRSRYLRAG